MEQIYYEFREITQGNQYKKRVKIDLGRVLIPDLGNVPPPKKVVFFWGSFPKASSGLMILTKMGDLECDANVFHSVRRQLGVLFTDALCNDVALVKSFLFND